MTAEAVSRDLYCHTLVKSNLSRDFPLFSSRFMGKCQRRSILSRKPSAPACLADTYHTAGPTDKNLTTPEGSLHFLCAFMLTLHLTSVENLQIR